VRASADNALLLPYWSATVEFDDAERNLATARELGDPALVTRALTAYGAVAAHDTEVALAYLAEAAGIARDLGDSWMLGQILALETVSALIVGDVRSGVIAAEEGLRVADCIGDGFVSRQCRMALPWAQIFGSDLPGAVARLSEVVEECNAANDAMYSMYAEAMRRSRWLTPGTRPVL
jgi:hypothetical protein